ncbi:unnamed protein product [Orchesella dallaii]|uniref:Uncharacterized protein n=1 Tax=Orchesella dallaii TaxID=48710 RepID=A0ABP1R101_9HEXA
MVDAFMFFLLKLSLIALGFCFLIVCLCVVLVLKWYRKSVEIKRRSRVYSSHGAQGYLESLETGSAAVTSIAESHYQSLARMETGISRNLQGNESSSTDLRKVKVACDDIPPQYETLSPPTYQSLFPEDETMIPHVLHINEKANPG